MNDLTKELAGDRTVAAVDAGDSSESCINESLSASKLRYRHSGSWLRYILFPYKSLSVTPVPYGMTFGSESNFTPRPFMEL
jgi:hypothetical protein